MEKVFSRILSFAGRHHIRFGYVKDYCGPLPDVVQPSSRMLTPSTLPSSCWTGTSSGTFASKHMTSRCHCWSPTTAPPIVNATGLLCASYAARGRVSHKKIQSPSRENSTLARSRLHKSSTGSSPLVSPNTIEYLEGL